MSNLKFCDDSVSNIEQSVLSAYEKIADVTLADADPITIFLKSLAYIIAEQRTAINATASQNMLATATGVYLDALGELVGVKRIMGGYASTTVRFYKTEGYNQNVLIAKDTRVTADSIINFKTVDNVVIKTSESYADVLCIATTEGVAGNNYDIHAINKLVDLVPYITSVENISVTSGGDDVESDAAYRERIRIAPENFSVAGPKLAYEYHALSVSPLITDVTVKSSTAGVVDVYLLLENGEPATAELVAQVKAELNDEKIRPLTDSVQVSSAEQVAYDVDITCYVYSDNPLDTSDIEAVVADYNTWQSTQMGRDVNPDELIYMLKSLGVKRVDIAQPAFKMLDAHQVAKVANVSIKLGGSEEA